MSDHPIYGLKEPSEWPIDPDRILSSLRWQTMKDFQRGWYFQLMLLMTRSKPLGYLPLTAQLWTLAGAHSKQYWDLHSGLVLACFKVCEFGGQQWIYSEAQLKVFCDKTYRHDIAVERGRRSNSSSRKRADGIYKYSLEFTTIWENTWKRVAKPQAFKAFTKALEEIEKDRNYTHDQALQFLADAMEEFKVSPAGKDNGMFDGYTPPYPASWLNAQRYSDDRRTWRPAGSNGTGKPGQDSAPHPRSFAEEKCPTCSGSGWDRSSGKATRCACFIKNRSAVSGQGAAAGR